VQLPPSESQLGVPEHEGTSSTTAKKQTREKKRIRERIAISERAKRAFDAKADGEELGGIVRELGENAWSISVPGE
jgi:hypothetical protein